jgi:hypothetical protein
MRTETRPGGCAAPSSLAVPALSGPSPCVQRWREGTSWVMSVLIDQCEKTVVLAACSPRAPEGEGLGTGASVRVCVWPTGLVRPRRAGTTDLGTQGAVYALISRAGLVCGRRNSRFLRFFFNPKNLPKIQEVAPELSDEVLLCGGGARPWRTLRACFQMNRIQ